MLCLIALSVSPLVVGSILQGSLIVASNPDSLIPAAKCTGATPCTACKNCKYCAYCNAGGGTCGACKSKP